MIDDRFSFGCERFKKIKSTMHTYLDYNASTPVWDEVLDIMREALGVGANPSSPHAPGGGAPAKSSIPRASKPANCCGFPFWPSSLPLAARKPTGSRLHNRFRWERSGFLFPLASIRACSNMPRRIHGYRLMFGEYWKNG